jgi:acyl carrier protein
VGESETRTKLSAIVIVNSERTQVLDGVKAALSRASNGRARLDQIGDDSLIIEDVGLASLDLLELRFELEERWNLRITDEEVVRLRTVGDIVSLLLQRGCRAEAK